MASGKQKYSFKQFVKSRTTRSDQQGIVYPLPPEANFAVPVSYPPETGNPTRPTSQTADELGIDLSFLPPHRPRDGDTVVEYFDVGKPTCSMNLLCHRNGILQKYQLQVISKDRCARPDQYNSLIASNKRLIKTDIQFFKAVRKTYEKEMYGIWRSLFSLRALREIRLVSFTPFDHRPAPAFLPEYIKQDILFAYRYPEKLHSNGEWIQWIYNLRQPGRRYALEFIENWSALRILIAVSVLLASSIALGIAWAVVKDDAQTAFTVATFVLGAGSLLLAALALVSNIEASTSDGSSQSQLLQDMSIHHTPADESPPHVPTMNLTDGSPPHIPTMNLTDESPHVPTRDLERRQEQDKTMRSFIIQGLDVTGPEDIASEFGSVIKD